MAKAFSYSGTGLESAIQTGSGGIGTGSSITLEVDTVPSDLSQGDTVKVALGGASDWSGGNGETAYGDIGGAGANGGTNITLTDRGREGTSAASWSEGDPVRVGVQGRGDAGPEQSFVQSQITKPSGRLVAYDDFAGPDVADVNGYTLPTGQTLTVQQGGAEISNGKLQATTTEAIVTLDLGTTASPTVWASLRLSGVFEGGAQGIILDYTDNNNFAYGTIERGFSESKSRLRIVENNGGTRTQIASSETLSLVALQSAFVQIRISRDSSDNLYSGSSYGVNVPAKKLNNTSITSRVGVILNQTDNYFENIVAYQ